MNIKRFYYIGTIICIGLGIYSTFRHGFGVHSSFIPFVNAGFLALIGYVHQVAEEESTDSIEEVKE